MIPSIAGGGEVRRSDLRVADYVAELDGLVLGAERTSARHVRKTASRPAWTGDRVRANTYEIDLLEDSRRPEARARRCRGLQLINVACGGTVCPEPGPASSDGRRTSRSRA
jgi:gamma-glutamyl-gamma-aminobutyrate hydrolase PuuD